MRFSAFPCGSTALTEDTCCNQMHAQDGRALFTSDHFIDHEEELRARGGGEQYSCATVRHCLSCCVSTRIPSKDGAFPCGLSVLPGLQAGGRSGLMRPRPCCTTRTRSCGAAQSTRSGHSRTPVREVQGQTRNLGRADSVHPLSEGSLFASWTTHSATAACRSGRPLAR
eukprot:SAG22_NODE_1757_length_3650_cov_2.473669_2_plen_169_part_00